VVVAVVTAGLVSSSATPGQGVGYETTVKSGHWHGVTWKFTARTGSDGSYCLDMEISGRMDGRSCGSIRDPGSRGISYQARSGRPAPNYVIGPVIGTARSVQISFFDRPPIRLSTIMPPPARVHGFRFFVSMLQCPATPRSFVALNATGGVVARLVVPRRVGPPKIRC
jgi:hypothetical protein